MKRFTPLVLALLATALLSGSCQRQSPVSRVNQSKLSFEEQGVWNRFQPFVNYIGNETTEAQKQLAEYLSQKKKKTKTSKKRADRALRAYYAHVRNLRNWIGRSKPTLLSPVRTLWPSSMRGLRRAYWNFLELGRKPWDFRPAAVVTAPVQTEILAAGRSILRAEAALARTFRKRPARGQPGSIDPGFAVEIAGIPLKFEVLHGKLKVKLSRSVGPLKFTGTAGAGSSSRRGCHTLVIESENWRRVFNFGAQSWQLPPLNNVAPIYDHKAGTLTLRTKSSLVWARQKR